MSGDLSQLVLPLGCASCGAVTSRAQLLVGPTRRELFVPYCSACLEQMGRAETVAVSVSLASGLLSLGLAFAFPVLWPLAPLWLHATSTLALSVSPHMLAYALSKGRLGASSARPSVRFARESELSCDHRPFAEELATKNGLGLRCRRELRLAGGRAAWLAPLFGVPLAVASYFWQHPTLRVLNSSGATLWLSVDGSEPVLVEASTIESPFAGASMRLPRGERTLTAKRASGELVARVKVVLDPGHDHLFAPGSDGECFWIESTGYGKERHNNILPLVSESRFWRLDMAIDTWFVPSPTAAADGRSTGGTLAALRHAPCERAPFGSRLPARGGIGQDGEASPPAIGP